MGEVQACRCISIPDDPTTLRSARRLRAAMLPRSPAELRCALAVVALTAVAAGAASVFKTSNGDALWLPGAGIAFAVAAVYGARIIPAVVAGRLVGAVTLDHSGLPWDREVAAALVGAAVLGAAGLLARRMLDDLGLRTLRDAVTFSGWAMAGALVSAAAIVGIDDIGRMGNELFASALRARAVAEAAGTASLAPALTLLAKARFARRPSFVQGLEVVLQAGAVAGAAWAAVHHGPSSPLVYLLLIAVGWVAVRGSVRRAAVAGLLAAVAATVTMTAESAPPDQVSAMEIFLVVCTTIGLWLGARDAERRAARDYAEQRRNLVETVLHDAHQARDEALAATDFYQRLLQVSPDYTFVREVPHGRVLYGTPGRDMIGTSTETLIALQASNASRLVHPDDAAAVAADNVAATALADGEVRSIRFRVDHPTLGWRWAEKRVTPLRRDPETGDVVEVLGVLRDITESVEAELALGEAVTAAQLREARFAALVEHSSDLTLVTDLDAVVTYASPSWTEVTGLPLESAIGTHLSEILHPDDRPKMAAMRETLLANPGAPLSIARRFRHTDGSWRHMEIMISNRLDDPAVRGVVSNSRDVSERTEIAERMAHEATHDPLTGLPNRTLLLERMDLALNGQSCDGTRCAALFVDLDRFKAINDSLGHAAGDTVLVTVAERISSTLRAGDTIARLGGDELVVLADDIGSAEEAVQLADRIRDRIAQPIDLEGTQFTPAASIGIAVSTPGIDAPALLQQADTALYRAKERGRNRSEMYVPAMATQARARLAVEQDLRSALDDGRVVVAYQPIVDLSGGTVVGHEALARLRSPGGELLPPGEFIPVAEETGMIVDLGAEVLRAACAQQGSWSGLASSVMSVNISAHQLFTPGFTRSVAEILQRSGLPADQLCVELTESTLIDSGPSSVRALESLKNLGVSIALDDFGTGWSSLAYLRRFPIDSLKIDRSFTAGLGTDGDATEVVRAIIGLGHALRITTVAEGVETETQERMLVELGCDRAQGYRYGRPSLTAVIPGSPSRGRHLRVVGSQAAG